MNPLDDIGNLKQDPMGSEKQLELINLIDQKVDEVAKITDSQGADILRLIVYVEALQQLLFEKGLATQDELNDQLTKAGEAIQKQLMEASEGDEQDSVDDIEL